MKNLTLIILLSVAFTAEAQTVKRDSTSKDSCNCYMRRKDPKQHNPYVFADSAKTKKPKKKTN